jgi:RNA polymerase sigma-70 factor (ECF subfamily)
MIDEHNFEAFMAAYQDMVFSTAMRLLNNSAEAEDISQEVFLKAYDRFAELGRSPTAGGWLKTVTRNLCLNHLSRYRARWTFFTDLKHDDTDERDFDIPAEDTQSGDAELSDKRQLLEVALQKLPPAHRIPLVLYHFEELSYEEIAARLKLSLAKVKTDIHRGREALRKKLKLDLEGELSGTVGMLPARLTEEGPNA